MENTNKNIGKLYETLQILHYMDHSQLLSLLEQVISKLRITTQRYADSKYVNPEELESKNQILERLTMVYNELENNIHYDVFMIIELVMKGMLEIDHEITEFAVIIPVSNCQRRNRALIDLTRNYDTFRENLPERKN